MNRNQYPKGSKGMIQCLVNEHKHLLDQRLGAVLRWISPIEKDGFAEYQLMVINCLMNWDFLQTHSITFGQPDNLNGMELPWMMNIRYCIL